MPISVPWDLRLETDGTSFAERAAENDEALGQSIPASTLVTTTLPTKPYGGQLIIFTVTWTDTGGTARKIRWQLLYDATDSRWYKIGGPPMFDSVETEEALAVTFSTLQDLATVGPKLTVPLTGVYLPSAAWYINNTSGAAQANTRAGLKINAGAVDTGIFNSGLMSSPAAGAFMIAAATPARPIALTAADALKVQYASLANVACSFGNRRLQIDPIYVTA